MVKPTLFRDLATSHGESSWSGLDDDCLLFWSSSDAGLLHCVSQILHTLAELQCQRFNLPASKSKDWFLGESTGNHGLYPELIIGVSYQTCIGEIWKGTNKEMTMTISLLQPQGDNSSPSVFGQWPDLQWFCFQKCHLIKSYKIPMSCRAFVLRGDSGCVNLGVIKPWPVQL